MLRKPRGGRSFVLENGTAIASQTSAQTTLHIYTHQHTLPWRNKFYTRKTYVSLSGACPGFFTGARLKGRKSRPKAESGVGFLGGAPSPLPTSPNRPKVSTSFSTQDGLSWHYNIVNCRLSCSHWGQDPRVPSPMCTPLVCVATNYSKGEF